jgi:hypothetical protein
MFLKAGAAAAVLAAVVGALFNRTAGRKLLQLHQACAPQSMNSPDLGQQLAALRMRAALGARVAAALLGVAVLAMATFRYASALV